MSPNTSPKKIEKVEDEALRILWEDGHQSVYSFRLLRQHCPCALCRDERTGKRLLDPDSVPMDLKATRAELVGNYALTLLFSDGHSTGIYSFEYLRRECPCQECNGRIG